MKDVDAIRDRSHVRDSLSAELQVVPHKVRVSSLTLASTAIARYTCPEGEAALDAPCETLSQAKTRQQRRIPRRPASDRFDVHCIRCPSGRLRHLTTYRSVPLHSVFALDWYRAPLRQGNYPVKFAFFFSKDWPDKTIFCAGYGVHVRTDPLGMLRAKW